MRGPDPRQRFKNIGVITVPYGGKTTQEAFHPAIDVAGEIGTPIPAMTGGKVVSVVDGKKQGDNDFGNTVNLVDQNGNQHQYHHLQSLNVRPGDQVQQGQVIATLGNTGATYSQSGKGDGANLDYRIVNSYGKYYNPLTYLKKYK